MEVSGFTQVSGLKSLRHENSRIHQCPNLFRQSDPDSILGKIKVPKIGLGCLGGITFFLENALKWHKRCNVHCPWGCERKK